MSTYDPTTDAGTVRLLINDTNVNGTHIFTDAEIARFLALEGSNVFLASALALDTIANNQAQVLKVIQILELKTDGAKTAEALRAQAAVLRERAYEDANDAGFEVVEMVVDDFTLRQRIIKEALRDA